MTAVQPSTVDRDLRGPPDKRLVALDDQIKSSLMEFGISGASCAVVVQQKIVAVSTPRDIARLFCSLLGGWGPLSAATLRNFWASIGVVDQQSTVEGFAGMEESQGFSVSNGGWQSSIYRGRRRLGFSSNGSGATWRLVASSKESHLPTAIADLACDYLFEVSTPTAWIERLATVPNPIPLPGELPMEISLPGNTSTSQSTQPAIRPLVGYAGLYISSAAPTIAVKITTDTTSLVATVSIAGAKVHPPTLLTSSHIDTFTCQIRTARPSLKQFISHEGVFHFRGTPTGQIDGVSLHPALFANMSQTLGPAVFFTKVSAGGPIQPNQTPSVNNAPVLSRTSSVISNGSASAVTGVSSNLAAPSLPPRRRQASQGPASNPQSQLQISVAPSTSNASAPLSPVAVRRPPPPLPPSIRREASAVSQSSLGGPSQITLDTQKSEKISESPAVYAVPIAIAPSTSAAPAITEVPVNASQDVLPAYDIYAETSGNATQRQSQSRPSSALAGPVASLTRDDSFIATASAVVASDKPTEEIEEDVESDMNALDGIVPNPTPAPALSKLAPNGSTLSLPEE
ncbi:hypothetical protein BC829DRAFT_405258 [Chytridium lagenaria]|nr:hypothetical protein BC829DRAFT_405258 [Chytridium lagenaria]